MLWSPAINMLDGNTVARRPEILNANENVEIHENSRLNSCLYPNLANSASEADKIDSGRSIPICFSSEAVFDGNPNLRSGEIDIVTQLSNERDV
jgi:hypothetical protein